MPDAVYDLVRGLLAFGSSDETIVAFTPEAQAIWDKVPEATRAKLLDSGFCTRCLATRHFELVEGSLRGKELVLVGKCGTCAARVVRLVPLD